MRSYPSFMCEHGGYAYSGAVAILARRSGASRSLSPEQPQMQARRRQFRARRPQDAFEQQQEEAEGGAGELSALHVSKQDAARAGALASQAHLSHGVSSSGLNETVRNGWKRTEQLDANPAKHKIEIATKLRSVISHHSGGTRRTARMRGGKRTESRKSGAAIDHKRVWPDGVPGAKHQQGRRGSRPGRIRSGLTSPRLAGGGVCRVAAQGPCRCPPRECCTHWPRPRLLGICVLRLRRRPCADEWPRLMAADVVAARKMAHASAQARVALLQRSAWWRAAAPCERELALGNGGWRQLSLGGRAHAVGLGRGRRGKKRPRT